MNRGLASRIRSRCLRRARVDFSLHRLKHYTATSPTHCQNYVLYTNYQFYIDEFVKLGRTMMAHTDDAELRTYHSEYTSFVEPGDVITYNAKSRRPGNRGHAAAASAADARRIT